jgi:hypothetical protein
MRSSQTLTKHPNVPVTILLRRDVRLAAEQAARDEKRSLSNYLSLMIENHVGADVPPGFLKQRETAGAR